MFRLSENRKPKTENQKLPLTAPGRAPVEQAALTVPAPGPDRGRGREPGPGSREVQEARGESKRGRPGVPGPEAESRWERPGALGPREPPGARAESKRERPGARAEVQALLSAGPGLTEALTAPEVLSLFPLSGF